MSTALTAALVVVESMYNVSPFGGRWLGRQASQGQFRVLGGLSQLAQDCIERAAGQEAIDRSCNEAAHDAFALDVDLGVDLGPAVELADVVVHVHLDERADGGEAQRLGARLVNLDVERQVLAGELARDASLAAGLEAIGV